MNKDRGALEDTRLAHALTSPIALTRTSGPWRWENKGRDGLLHDGSVTVVSAIPDTSLVLRMVVSERRPSEPKLQYVERNGWIRRLCVNTEHRPLNGTHKHAVGLAGDVPYEPHDIPDVPLQPTIGPGVLYGIFEAFATECGIRLSGDLAWAPPWRGA